MNTFQKTTKSGKPVINSLTKLPEYTKSVHSRINKICKELGIQTKNTHKGITPIYTHDQRMSMIRQEISLLTI